MAKVYSTGPAYVFVGFGPTQGGSSPAAEFLGTCEDAPDIELLPGWREVKNDLGGKVLPFDKSFQGIAARIQVRNLNRFNWGIYQKLAAVPFSSSAMGKSAFGDIGTIMIQEGAGLTVSIQFPYNKFSAYADLPPGYRFWACSFEGPSSLKPGTEDCKATLIFEANRVFNVKDGSFTCFDTAIGNLPAIN